MGSKLASTVKPQDKSDIRPGLGGEFFGDQFLTTSPGNCFVCGVRRSRTARNFLLHTLTAFVVSNDAGKRVVAMFTKGAQFFYGINDEPRCVQICACDEHLENLKKLAELTKDGVITSARIREAGGEQGVDLDELQAEAEKLVALLKDREPGHMTWHMCMRERLIKLDTIIALALNK